MTAEFTQFEYITVHPAGTSASGRTLKFVVRGARGDVLGTIRWFGRWRQYVFLPEPDTLYSRGCLLDLASFLDSLRAGAS